MIESLLIELEDYSSPEGATSINAGRESCVRHNY
jgi:hypothetical protein